MNRKQSGNGKGKISIFVATYGYDFAPENL